MIWCARSKQKFVKTDGSPFRRCSCISSKFQELFSTKFWHRLDFRKLCSCWVPTTFSEEHRNKRAASALTFLTRYSEQGDGLLSQIVTADETWVSHLTPESKQQSTEWRHTSSPKKHKFKHTISTRKIMCTVFWDRQVLFLEFLPQGTTINSITYCETTKRLRRAIQNKRPHNAAQTQALITSFGCERFGHPHPLQPRLSGKWLPSVPAPEEVPCWPAFPQQWRRQRKWRSGCLHRRSRSIKKGYRNWCPIMINALIMAETM